MFPFLKTKLFLFFVLASVIGTFYYFGDTQKLSNTIIPKLKETPFAPVAEKFEQIDTKKVSEDFQKSVQEAESEISTLSQKTTEASKHAGNVLGSSIQSAEKEESTPLHEKAFEYGKYIYCKQVVEDYEELNGNLK